MLLNRKIKKIERFVNRRIHKHICKSLNFYVKSAVVDFYEEPLITLKCGFMEDGAKGETAFDYTLYIFKGVKAHATILTHIVFEESFK